MSSEKKMWMFGVLEFIFQGAENAGQYARDFVDALTEHVVDAVLASPKLVVRIETVVQGRLDETGKALMAEAKAMGLLGEDEPEIEEIEGEDEIDATKIVLPPPQPSEDKDGDESNDALEIIEPSDEEESVADIIAASLDIEEISSVEEPEVLASEGMDIEALFEASEAQKAASAEEWRDRMAEARSQIFDACDARRIRINPEAEYVNQDTGLVDKVLHRLSVWVARGEMEVEEALDFAIHEGWTIPCEVSPRLFAEMMAGFREKGLFFHRTAQIGGKTVDIQVALAKAIEEGKYTLPEAIAKAQAAGWTGALYQGARGSDISSDEEIGKAGADDAPLGADIRVTNGAMKKANGGKRRKANKK